jgi:hypothetical protein
MVNVWSYFASNNNNNARIAYNSSGTAVDYWLRDTEDYGDEYDWDIYTYYIPSSGYQNYAKGCTSTSYIRPAFILDDFYTVSNTTDSDGCYVY